MYIQYVSPNKNSVVQLFSMFTFTTGVLLNIENIQLP